MLLCLTDDLCYFGVIILKNKFLIKWCLFVLNTKHNVHRFTIDLHSLKLIIVESVPENIIYWEMLFKDQILQSKATCAFKAIGHLKYYSMKCFTFWENIQTLLSLLNIKNNRFILNTCQETANVRKQGWVFQLFSIAPMTDWA